MPKHKAKPRHKAKPKPATAKQSNTRVKEHRDRLRAAGLKPIQLWVWDTTRPGFAERVQRECKIVNASADSQRVLAEIEALTDFESWKLTEETWPQRCCQGLTAASQGRSW